MFFLCCDLSHPTPSLYKRGMSTKLAVMSNMLMRHAHDAARSTSSLSSSSSLSSHVQIGQSSSFILGPFKHSDIAHIHIAQHKQHPTHHIFFVTSSNTGNLCRKTRIFDLRLFQWKTSG